MKIRTRAFLLGLLPTLLLAAVLSAYHVITRLDDLETNVSRQGMELARRLAASAEYGVLSGNNPALEKLLDQALTEPGVKSAIVVWPDQTTMIRGESINRLPDLRKVEQWQTASRSWFVFPVRFAPAEERDIFFDDNINTNEPLAWVAVSMDANQKQALAKRLLLASMGITLLGLLLSILLINKLALTGLQPLMDIIAAMKNISSGNFGKRVKVTAHSPEMRQLQSMVNKMSESLRSYQQDMEEKVRLVTAELEHKKREAEQANLAKSKFLATASHDLRQPMHAIGLYVESLKPQMQGRAAEDTLNKIERSISGMVELFNAILDVTKLDAGVVQPNIAPLRIRKMFLYLADEFAPEAENKGLSLRVRAPDVWVESDEILLERILRNLLSNAIRHTRQGGVLISARRCQGKLRLQVWDTGTGIEPEHQSRIFDEFYQASADHEQARQGLGLGLAIVRRLTRLLGYPLQLQSRTGRGTAISIDVPMAPIYPDRIEHRAEMGDGTIRGVALLVDDDPSVLDALGNLLEQWGMGLIVANSLQQTKQVLQVSPDIVLVDYQLQNGETGLMVAEEVQRRHGGNIPIVLITGDTRTETIKSLRASGFPILHKPVRIAQLRTMLESLLPKEKAVKA